MPSEVSGNQSSDVSDAKIQPPTGTGEGQLHRSRGGLALSPSKERNLMKIISLFCMLPLLALTTCEPERPKPAPQDFGHHRELEQQRETLRKQMDDQQSRLSRWQIAAIVFGIGCPVLLMIGAALGSKAKRHGH
jgi:hypothetical protein